MPAEIPSGRAPPFGRIGLGLGAALLLGSPFAVYSMWKFDDWFLVIIGVYATGGMATFALALAAFLTTGRRAAPQPPPPNGTRPEAPPGWPAAPLPAPQAPPGATGERVAATAGVALAGIGCSAIAGVVLVAMVLLAFLAYMLFEVAKVVFGA